MVNIYLFIELIRAASAPDVADRIKGHEPRQLQIRQCGGAVLRQAGGAARLLDAEDGTRVVLEELPKVEGVVQTNVIAVVKPVQH